MNDFIQRVLADAAEMRKNIVPSAETLRLYESICDGDGGELLSDLRLNGLSEQDGDPLPIEHQPVELRRELRDLAVKRAAACLLLLECWGFTDDKSEEETMKLATAKPTAAKP